MFSLAISTSEFFFPFMYFLLSSLALMVRPFFVFGSEGQFSERMHIFAKQFDRLKKENNIKSKCLVRKGREKKETKLSKYKYLDVKKSPVVTNIYGKKLALVFWTEEPEGIVIENEEVAKAYKSYFDILWKVAK